MRTSGDIKYRIICIGASAGGLKAVSKILSYLPEDFAIPIVIVQHLHEDQNIAFAELVNSQTALTVKIADEKEKMLPGHAYYAPPDYHLMVEEEGFFSLSTDEKVNFSRPSIDVLFESVADDFAPAIIGVILTGANNDGAMGMKLIKKSGGLTIVQDPKTAESSTMPSEAMKTTEIDYVLPLDKIGKILKELGKKGRDDLR